MALTAKQDHFARLAASGTPFIDARLQAYAVRGPATSRLTLHQEAYQLAHHPGIASRIRQLRDAACAQDVVSRSEVLAELKAIALAPIKARPTYMAKVAALDRIARILGLYEHTGGDKPTQITHVTVVLDRGGGNRVEETRVLQPKDEASPEPVTALVSPESRGPAAGKDPNVSSLEADGS